jgi:molybdate transport system substrate-binding protein
MKRVFALAALALLAAPAYAWAADITVVSSGGFFAALHTLAPQFEKQSGDHLIIEGGPSMGTTHDAVPQRLARHEPIDVVIMVGYSLDDLAKQGKVIPDSRVALAHSGIGIVVKHGAPHPDVATADALRKALLAAKSVAYSDSASGVYIQNEMFRKMGIEEQMKKTARMIPATPVGQIVAEGGAEIGFQQTSELKPIKGIDLLGVLPPELNQVTVFSAGIVAGSKEQAEAKKLIAFLASPAAKPAIVDSFMQPGAQ